MDRTKIPKPSQLKPPKIRSNITAFQGILDNIPENKPPQKSVAPVKVAVKPFSHALRLKRRSKSVTDLRPIASRPLTEFKSNVANNIRNKPTSVTNKETGKPATRTAAKRPAEQDGNNEVKPKVLKVPKIPDWDYKSRFNFLNEKHSLLQHSLKDAKQKLSDLADVETKFNDLKAENDKLNEENAYLKTNKTLITEENGKLSAENEKLQGDLSCLRTDHESLTQKYTNLLAEHKASGDIIKELRDKNNQLQNELDLLRKQHSDLTEEHDQLTNNHTVLRLDYDTKVRENQCLEEKLADAMQAIESLEAQTCKQKGELIANEGLRRHLHNTIQDLKGNIRVFCRVRPPLVNREQDRLLCFITYNDECNMEIRKSRDSVSTISGRLNDLKLDFTFDKVFPPESTQSEVFEELAQLVQSALDGYHVCVFAYGQTGSGKTFTMQGEAPDNLGMIPRSIDLIFSTIEKLKSTGWEYIVEASFLEIYNEAINDLLEPDSKQSYEIRFNEGRGTTVTNLKIQAISSADELKQLMQVAQQNRAVAATDFNEHSSRSHAVTKIYLKGINSESNLCYYGSVNLVDLAGSESAKTSSNERLTETKNINKSLSTLGNVMLALHNKDPHVPYRNSKLTYLLQSCLGGNSKTLMFVNISPFEDCYNESVNSLRFASKVKEVKTGSKRNKNYLGSASLPPVSAGRLLQ